MGSKDRWLGGLGLMDVISTLEAFEVMNSCSITIALNSEDEDGRPGPWLIGRCWKTDPAGAGPALLVSARLRCQPRDFQTLDTAAFRVLYLLDGKLAEHEMNGGDIKKA